MSIINTCILYEEKMILQDVKQTIVAKGNKREDIGGQGRWKGEMVL